MRLKSLYIEEYKNIRKQTFDFSNNTGFIALIGLNGSGKSNLLEAISLIFDDLYGIQHAEQVKGYTITYEIGGVTYTYSTLDEHNNVIQLSKGEKVCPSSVIACYSGEDLRLWHMAYESYYMQYFKEAIRDKSFSPIIMYINKYCWKVALISLLCSSKKSIKEFIKNILSITDITSVDIHLDADETRRALFSDHAACRWYDNIKRLQDEDEHQLVNANIIATTDMMTYGAPHPEAPDYVFQFLYLLSLPEKNADKGQTVNKLITDVKVTINGVNFDYLSEGEKKMILIECITQVLGDENSLVLLDEPDAHVHIENKKIILETIAQYDGQTIFTTHSPVMCNLIAEANNIKLLKDGKHIDTSKLEQLKKLSGNALQYFEGAFVLSYKKILVTEGIYDIRYLRKAIDVFAKRDHKYEKLKTIGMLYAGSASEEHVIYDELLKGMKDNLECMVFLFDYDGAGVKEWKIINQIAATEPKVVPLFYQNNYGMSLDVTKDNVLQQDSIMVEDLFDEASYASLFINPAVMTATHKYFRCRQKITDRIKTHIQENYASFNDNYYDKYEPLLDKLLEVFGLN